MFISIDIGGTNTRVSSSKDLINIHKVVKFNSANSFKKEQELLMGGIFEVSEGKEIGMLSFGVPGIVDQKKKEIIKLPNYPPLNGKKYQEIFGNLIKPYQVFTQNDAKLAALAEATDGVASKFKRVAYITLGTGVGGALIVDKKLDNANYEPGHQLIVEEGKFNPGCGQYGCFESYCSGTSFEEIYHVSSKDCDDESIWNDYAMHLSTGLNNILALWNPDVIVLGGSVSNKYNSFIDTLNSNLDRQSFFDIPPILKSKFGDDSGLIGGFIHLRNIIKESKPQTA